MRDKTVTATIASASTATAIASLHRQFRLSHSRARPVATNTYIVGGQAGVGAGVAAVHAALFAAQA